MTTPRDRDTHLEQWLRGASAAADGETPFCLDAETAAAWADGGLTGSALERVQLHVSDCARCQALAGSIVRASEASAFAPAAETEGRWRRWFTWVAPLTAAAAAVVAIGVWVRTPVPAAPSVRQVASPPVTETQGSPRLEADARATATPAATVAAARDATPAPATSALAKKAERLDLSRGNLRDQVPGPGAQARVESAPQKALDKASARADSATDAFSVAPAPAAPATAPPTAPQTARAATAAAPAATTAGALEERVVSPTPPPPSARGAATASSSADSKTSGAAPLAGRARAAEQGVGWTVVVAPGGLVQWRFDGNQLQHSIDRGVSWTVVEQTSASQIRAGSAPTASVCWLVGRAGLVMLTTDGTSWSRMSSPVAIDLASVVATDARIASVAADDGRRFQTSDGGRTWTAR